MLTATERPHLPQGRPAWLDKKIRLKDCHKMKNLLKGLNLHTVCEEAACPNISECFSRTIATFMILGKVCTRNCRFCNVEKGNPEGVDQDEPERVAEAAGRLKLKHIVITSVTRDDLDDGGAAIFVKTVFCIRKKTDRTAIEVLMPDFKGDAAAIKKVAEAGPDVINHNIETVPRLYEEARPEADYQRSLEVLRIAKESSNGRKIYTKSGLMVGLGETEDEVLEVFSDLRDIDCDFLSIGQYLAPSKNHYPVKEYVTPDQFQYYKDTALQMGFLHVESGPYVRSSYCASEYLGTGVEHEGSCSTPVPGGEG